MTADRPRGGRRPEDFPAARERDEWILDYLRQTNSLIMPHQRTESTRNMIAYDLEIDDPRKVTYSLHRLKARGLVEHVPQGNEGHGYWKITEEANREDTDH